MSHYGPVRPEDFAFLPGGDFSVGRFAQVASAAPVAVASDALLDGRVRKFEAIMLPLASDGRTVDKVLVGQVWV